MYYTVKITNKSLSADLGVTCYTFIWMTYLNGFMAGVQTEVRHDNSCALTGQDLGDGLANAPTSSCHPRQTPR